ncbi:MAG TPA: energy transducer TonB [Candidatus Sulfotelmatobacter sp.]|nr:energy transducer TonB [Candidatus Sulfotelmatobacter sp.]
MPKERVHLLFALKFVIAAFILGCSLAAQNSSANNDETIYELHNAHESGIQGPKAIYTPEPEYTDKARRKKINGVVLLSFVVAKDGTVRDPAVTRSLESSLDKQALDTVKKWRFEPATKDGQPVAVRIQAEMSFHIR